MLVLALDTTTRGGSVAIAHDADVLALVEGDATRTHGERLPAEIDEALTRASVRAADLDLLAVASGPGAFTGLRIGLAAMQGLAMVLRKPVIGVSALDALVETLRHTQHDDADGIGAWMDAQRGEVFAAWYRHKDETPQSIGTPVVGSPDAVLESRPFAAEDRITLTGDGALRYRSVIEARLGTRGRIVERQLLIAPAIARLGQRRAAAGGAGPPHALQPLYVRRPDAEIERDRKIES